MQVPLQLSQRAPAFSRRVSAVHSGTARAAVPRCACPSAALTRARQGSLRDVDSVAFQLMTGTMIIFNTIVLGVEADHPELSAGRGVGLPWGRE